MEKRKEQQAKQRAMAEAQTAAFKKAALLKEKQAAEDAGMAATPSRASAVAVTAISVAGTT